MIHPACVTGLQYADAWMRSAQGMEGIEGIEGMTGMGIDMGDTSFRMDWDRGYSRAGRTASRMHNL